MTAFEYRRQLDTPWIYDRIDRICDYYQRICLTGMASLSVEVFPSSFSRQKREFRKCATINQNVTIACNKALLDEQTTTAGLLQYMMNNNTLPPQYINHRLISSIAQREEQQKHVASMMTGSPSSAARMAPASTAPQTIGDATAAVPTHNMGDKINANVIQQITGGRVPPRPLWRNGEKTFPYKVYDMLEFAETSGNTDICSWLPSGDSFVIHDRKLFTEFILPRFFLHKKWRSFVSCITCVLLLFCRSTAPSHPAYINY